MNPRTDEELRLQLLNSAQPGRLWQSCSERRRCVECENTFSGNAVIIRRTREGATRLACPKCGSGPELWVRPGNPYTDECVWAEWESAIAVATAEADDDLLAEA